MIVQVGLSVGVGWVDAVTRGWMSRPPVDPREVLRFLPTATALAATAIHPAAVHIKRPIRNRSGHALCARRCGMHTPRPRVRRFNPDALGIDGPHFLSCYSSSPETWFGPSTLALVWLYLSDVGTDASDIGKHRARGDGYAAASPAAHRGRGPRGVSRSLSPVRAAGHGHASPEHR